jgi:hypothetical protein
MSTKPSLEERLQIVEPENPPFTREETLNPDFLPHS